MAIENSLRTSQLFAGVPADAIQAALDSGVRRRAKRGSCFFRSDEPANCLFVLVRGRVKLCYVTPRGYRVLFRLIGPGELFGYQAVLNSGRYFTTAEAAVDSEALCWSRAVTRRLLKSDPTIAVNALAVSLMRMQEYQQRLAEMASEPVATRIARQLIRLESVNVFGANSPGTISGEFTREDLAGLAGSTLHTVSRVLGRWERAHIVEKAPGMIRITAPEELAHIAGF